VSIIWLIALSVMGFFVDLSAAARRTAPRKHLVSSELFCLATPMQRLFLRKSFFALKQRIRTRPYEINDRSSDGETILLLAAAFGDFKVARMLLRAGANTDIVDEFNNTPLMLAARYGFLKIVKLLLHYRANVHVVSVKGRTAFSLANDRGYEEIAALIAQYAQRQKEVALSR
jgi:ankyrin repeat protein